MLAHASTRSAAGPYREPGRSCGRTFHSAVTARPARAGIGIEQRSRQGRARGEAQPTGRSSSTVLALDRWCPRGTGILAPAILAGIGCCGPRRSAHRRFHERRHTHRQAVAHGPTTRIVGETGSHSGSAAGAEQLRSSAGRDIERGGRLVGDQPARRAADGMARPARFMQPSSGADTADALFGGGSRTRAAPPLPPHHVGSMRALARRIASRNWSPIEKTG